MLMNRPGLTDEQAEQNGMSVFNDPKDYLPRYGCGIQALTSLLRRLERDYQLAREPDDLASVVGDLAAAVDIPTRVKAPANADKFEEYLIYDLEAAIKAEDPKSVCWVIFEMARSLRILTASA